MGDRGVAENYNNNYIEEGQTTDEITFGNICWTDRGITNNKSELTGSDVQRVSPQTI